MKLDYRKIINLMAKQNMSRPEFLDKAGISDFTMRSISKGKSCRTVLSGAPARRTGNLSGSASSTTL